MCLIQAFKLWRRRRRDRIYGGPYVDGGTRISKDTDAPKEIRSRELIRFSCSVSMLSMMEEDTGLPCGMYRFTAKREESGAVCGASFGRGCFEKVTQSRCDPALLDAVAELLRRYNVAQYNGSYYKVSGLPDFYGAELDADYASGESISCYHNQDQFLPVELLQALCDLFSLPSAADISS